MHTAFLVYQWSYYYFTEPNGFGNRRTKDGPVFSQLNNAIEDLNKVKNDNIHTFFTGFIYEYKLDFNCYGNIVYKTDMTMPINQPNCHIEDSIQIVR